MFRKSFISIYFLANKIFIIQLDSRRKKVKKHAILDLPNGLIKNYKVQDKKVLANILKKAWSKFHLKERSLGLVIPEFSTFTKLLRFPKLNFLELNEAVNWQAQDYLPTSSSEMVIDWEIVGQTDKEYEVLVVAMNKTILEGYIGAAEAAGLFPLAVETPSLCLVRVTAEDEVSGRLIVFQSLHETLLVIASDRKIFGTSVIASGDVDKIVATAFRIISHYKQVKVEKILVGGEIDEKLMELLIKKIEKEVKWIKLEIKGLSQKASQEYLIPICMQLNELEEPSDPYSLNLLPLNLVEGYKKAKMGLQVWSLTLTTTFFIWISFLATLGAYLFMNQQLSDLKEKSLSKASIFQKREEAITHVSQINEVTERVLKIKNSTISPQAVLNDINFALPEGVVIDKHKMDLDVGIIILEGNATNRLSLVNFKKNLEQNSLIGSVEVPITTFQTENDIDFGLTFEYKTQAIGSVGKKK